MRDKSSNHFISGRSVSGRLLAAAGGLALCLSGGAAFAQVETPEDANFAVETVAERLDHPWSIAFLPDGGMLVTELTGQLRVIRDGALVETPVEGVPEVLYGGQGGLSDVVLHPDFAENGLVYLTYSVETDKGNTLRVGRGTFTGDALENFEVVFEADAYRDTMVHYGARMAFLPDGTFLLNSGDGFDYREQAQRKENHFGSILRLNADGSAPADNPFVGEEGAKPEIWSIGHRNMQAILYDAETGTVYENEHGPKGGDELNVITKGSNYGWPLATYGMDYSGAYVSPYTEYEGTVQPIKYWDPSIAPSGMTLYRGDAFPAWDGDILITALAEQSLHRVDIENGEVVSDEVILGTAFGAGDPGAGERLRDVRTAPDGTVYVLTDGAGGKVLRLVPAAGMPTASTEPAGE